MKTRRLYNFISLFLFYAAFALGQQRSTLLAPDQGNQDSLIGARDLRIKHYNDSALNAFYADKALQKIQRAIRDSLLIDSSRVSKLSHDTLYTWTTKKQIAFIRKNKALLIQSRSKSKGASLYDQFITDTALKRDPMIVLLSEPGFEKKRFAWTDAWPTMMGWKHEKYGDQLIRIVLKDSAIGGYLEETGWKDHYEYKLIFFDLKGHRLSNDYVLNHTAHLAFVYHIYNEIKIKKQENKRFKGSYRARRLSKSERTYASRAFSEFVIINEEMVKTWEHGTDAIKSRIDSEIRFLKALKEASIKQEKFLSKENRLNYSRANDRTPSDLKLIWEFYNKRSIVNDYYQLKPARFNCIIKELEKKNMKQSEPFRIDK